MGEETNPRAQRKKTMDKPLKLIETSWELFGAKTALSNLHGMGRLELDTCGGASKKEKRVYNAAAYELLMHDEDMLLRWLAAPASVRWRYSEYERDRKGGLIKCKAVAL